MDSTRIPPNELVAHAGFVRSLAYHLLRNDADADDAAQETLARAIARPPAREGPIRPWLSGVLRNVVRRGGRDAGRRGRREAQVAALERTSSTVEFAAREQILRTVGAAVLALEEPQRVVILLRHYEGLPPREIAERLGLPVETVKSRLKRAHERLREALDEGRRGNVEGWRSSLALLVGADPRRGPGPESASGSSASTIGGVVMAGKMVGMLATALLVVGGGLLLLWRGATPPAEPPASTASTHETATGPASNVRPPDLAASPRPPSTTPGKQKSESDAKPAAAPTSGLAAGWKRWTVGAIQLDVPESWEHAGPPATSSEQSGSWSTLERPWPNATIQLRRDGAEGYEKLLGESSASVTEQIQVSGRAATLRIFEPRIGPPGVDLKALLVTIDPSVGDGRPLAFFAASTRGKFAEFEQTYRAIVASARLVDSDTPTGNEMPSSTTIRGYDGETAADVFEGVVLLGDPALPGGEVRIGPVAKPRIAAIGADGRFRFERVESGELGRVEITPAGVSSRELFLSPTPKGGHRRVILVVGRSIVEGRVFDRDGRAVSGTIVRVMWNGRKPSAAYTDNVVLATTDADGRYRADHLLPGRYQLHALVGRGVSRDGLVEVAGTKPASCDLGSSTPEPTLSGVVRRVGGAVPGPGYLMFSSADGKAAESASYDVDGRFSARLAAGKYLVRVQLPAPSRSVLLDAPVVVTPGVSTTDLTLPSGRLRGRVIDAATRLPRPPEKVPRNAAQLCFQLQGGVAFQTDLCVQIADDGTFQLDFLAPGKYAVVSGMPLAPGPDGKPRVIEVLEGGAETSVELERLSK